MSKPESFSWPIGATTIPTCPWHNVPLTSRRQLAKYESRTADTAGYEYVLVCPECEKAGGGQ